LRQERAGKTIWFLEPVVLADLEVEVVAIHGRFSGRIPSAAKVTWEEDFVVCVLEGVLTEPELALLAAGHFERVRADRQAFRAAVEPALRASVESLTGRPVRAYLTEVGPDDVGFDAFILGR
jgi:uncharacterized protein YbcI